METTNKTIYLTKEGKQTLEEELKDLVDNQRPLIANRLKEAKDYGDLSENIQWDDAKDRQAFIEGRISEIEHILKHAVIIEASGSHREVSLGSTVHLELEGGMQKYTIVGSTEADPNSGKISNESPIGRALIGKKTGDEVEINVPSGTMAYKVVKII